MTTKHTPATPLPYKYLRDEGQFIVDANQQIVAEIPCQGVPKNHGDYIVHSANAYPRNIALLKKIMRIYTNAASGARFAEQFPAADVRALLRELGEDA